MSASISPSPDAPVSSAKSAERDIAPIHDWIYHFMLWSYKQCFKAWGWQIHGRENVPCTGPVIIAPNHASMFDPPLIGCATPRLVTTMGKAELFEKRTFGLKILGFIIQHMGTFPVRRGSGDRRAMRRARQVLKDGGALVIFPEGTRTPNGEFGPPELGLALLAHSSKAPIVPAYIGGTQAGLSKLEPRLRPVKAQVWYGEPLFFEAEYARKGDRATLQSIAERVMLELGRLREAARAASGETAQQGPRSNKSTPEGATEAAPVETATAEGTNPDATRAV